MQKTYSWQRGVSSDFAHFGYWRDISKYPLSISTWWSNCAKTLSSCLQGYIQSSKRQVHEGNFY